MIIFTIVSILVIVLDQISKIHILEYLRPISQVPLIKNVLNLTYVENTGAAFGMLSNSRWIFMVASILIIIILVAYILIAKPKSKATLISLGMICGGGIGNMIDRIFKGYVVDFIDVTCINFYVFNIADSFVCVGCALLVLFLIIEEVKTRKAKKNAQVESKDE